MRTNKQRLNLRASVGVPRGRVPAWASGGTHCRLHHLPLFDEHLLVGEEKGVCASEQVAPGRLVSSLCHSVPPGSPLSSVTRPCAYKACLISATCTSTTEGFITPVSSPHDGDCRRYPPRKPHFHIRQVSPDVPFVCFMRRRPLLSSQMLFKQESIGVCLSWEQRDGLLL